MMDGVKSLLGNVLRGIYDSFIGALRVLVFRTSQEPRNVSGAADAMATSLGRRRAERLKMQTAVVAGEKSILDNVRIGERFNIRQQVGICCLYNGLALLGCSLFFNHILIPFMVYLLPAYENVVSTTAVVILHSLYLIPQFILSKVLNIFFFQDIANATYRESHGRPRSIPSVSRMCADMVFSILFQTVFLLQALATNYIPIYGVRDIVFHIHMSLLCSLYAFEYKLSNMGWEVHKRVSYMEDNWPYFVGFGLPMSLITSLFVTSFLGSSCMFALLFPLLIISANEAKPCSKPFNMPVRFFLPVVWICNLVFSKTMKVQSVQQTIDASTTSTPVSDQPKISTPSHTKGTPTAVRRSMPQVSSMKSSPVLMRGTPKRVKLVDPKS